MWQMIGVLAELERSLITERTRAGVQAAKQRGVIRPQAEADAAADHPCPALRAQGEPVPVIAALFKVHRATLYRAWPTRPSPFPGRSGHPPVQGIEGPGISRQTAGWDRLAKPRTLCVQGRAQLGALWGRGSPSDARLRGWQAHYCDGRLEDHLRAVAAASRASNASASLRHTRHASLHRRRGSVRVQRRVGIEHTGGPG